MTPQRENVVSTFHGNNDSIKTTEDLIRKKKRKILLLIKEK
jgi:hypothetical protein